ncbi:MAG: hypothetical protein ACO307_06225, partial [Ilumatobacteraceae bacterium]
MLGPSAVWRAVAVAVYGTAFLRRTFGRRPELLGESRLRPGEGIIVSTSAPRRRPSRRSTRR